LPPGARCATISVIVRLPRRGILIRLCIYLPLVGYFGWRAFDRWWLERHPPAAEQDPLDPYRRKIVLPDGSEQEVIELTREQAEQLIGPLPADLDAKAGESPKNAPAPAPSDERKATTG
jgi:hypothetical protein